jgi:hypothetical protein
MLDLLSKSNLQLWHKIKLGMGSRFVLTWSKTRGESEQLKTYITTFERVSTVKKVGLDNREILDSFKNFSLDSLYLRSKAGVANLLIKLAKFLV